MIDVLVPPFESVNNPIVLRVIFKQLNNIPEKHLMVKMDVHMLPLFS
jgi:hypothetical protein